MTTAAFADLLARINARPRQPGQATAALCQAWRDGGEGQRVLEALLGWEVAEKRLAGPGDLRAIAVRVGRA